MVERVACCNHVNEVQVHLHGQNERNAKYNIDGDILTSSNRDHARATITT